MPNLPFSAALCDDDPAARTLLADATRQWAKARHIDLALTEFPSAESFLFVRAGRGLLLQLNYVKKVTRTEVTLTDGTILPLPRGAYEPLNRAIIRSN